MELRSLRYNLWDECYWWQAYELDGSLPTYTNYTYDLTTWDAAGNGSELNSSTTNCGEIAGIPSSGYMNPAQYLPDFGENANWQYSNPPYNEQYLDQQRYVLKTGSQAVPGQQNLWVIHATAQHESIGEIDNPGSAIPPSQITVAGQTLDANGNAYLLLANNAQPDVTPMAPGNYTFSGPSATEYQPQIQANGVTLDPSKINATFCVGQQITFTLNLAVVFCNGGPLVSFTNVLCNWTLPAKFVNFSTTNSAACIIYTNNSSLLVSTNNSCNCWYVSGSGGTVSVGANLIMPNGKSVSIAALGKFAIYRPTLIDFGTSPPFIVTNAVVDGSLSLSLGNGNNYNMDFEVAVDSEYAGHADYTQLINRSATSGYTTTTTDGQFWLDNNRLYLNNPTGLAVQSNNPKVLTLFDGPYIALNSPSATIFDQFEDYVVFQPAIAGSIWVTLGKTSWSWSGATTFQNGVWTPATGSVSPPAGPDSSDDFPNWNHIFSP